MERQKPGFKSYKDYGPGGWCSGSVFDPDEPFSCLSSFSTDLQGPIALNSVLKVKMTKYPKNCRQ